MQLESLNNGRYVLADPLGEGGMAIVFRAWDSNLRVWRAIKILDPDLFKRRKIRQRFADEAHAMARLAHRNVVKVFDVGVDGELAYMVMELAEGGSPLGWIEAHGPMPPRMAVDVMRQVCSGIAAAHADGIVHRDIKPHNILVTAEGECKVTDFGIAQLDDLDYELTKTGMVMGTLGYMAPEQRANAKDVDERSDIYAIGATLHNLLTSRVEMDLFMAKSNLKMLDGVPMALIPVLVKATAYDRDHRYATAREFGRALRDVRERLPENPADTPPLIMLLPDAPGGVPVSGSNETFPVAEAPPEPEPTTPRHAHPTIVSFDEPAPRPNRSIIYADEEPTDPRVTPDPIAPITAPITAPTPPKVDQAELNRDRPITRFDSGPTGAEKPDEDSSPVAILWFFLMDVLTHALRFFGGPGKWIVLPVLLFLGVTGGFVHAGRVEVETHYQRTAAALSKLEAALDNDPDLAEVIAIARQQVDAKANIKGLTMLADEYYGSPPGAAKRMAALELAIELDRHGIGLRANGKVDPKFRKELIDRIGPIASKGDRYRMARAEWGEAADRADGTLAILSGWATSPAGW